MHWVEPFIARAARLGAQGADEIMLSIGPAPLVPLAQPQPIWRQIRTHVDVSSAMCEKLWNQWSRNVTKRVGRAESVIRAFLDTETLPEGVSHQQLRDAAPTLNSLVALPKPPVASSDHSLLRYLWGCGVLGADHLQYPENIILATHDFVRQNISDNVVYAEVRCETPGYTRAGMGAETATDLLCAGFDMAEIFEHRANFDCSADKAARAPKKSLLRTNVLLGAKRHKKPEEIDAVINLMIRYGQRPSNGDDYDTRENVGNDDVPLPIWWKPTQVVGFDLSGDESKSPDELIRQIRRLAALSSPITIHAGEAASAESVWRAVYEFHARRIGHGLRLRERGQLLQFCINEGICMEMCPISNVFTSDFVQFDKSPSEYSPHRVELYPLRYFMQSGLEVCINTDNRSLHGEYGTTLTDDYLWAARLSAGFTRWEILKLIKASFKNAFMDKREIQDLIQAVENWIFTQVANAPGLDWKPRNPSI